LTKFRKVSIRVNDLGLVHLLHVECSVVNWWESKSGSWTTRYGSVGKFGQMYLQLAGINTVPSSIWHGNGMHPNKCERWWPYMYCPCLQYHSHEQSKWMNT